MVTPWRSYEAYPIIAGLSGARLVQAPLDGDCRADAAAMLAAVGPRCRVAVLCNPNNPTGTALPPEEVDALIAALPSRVLVVLDEAYVDYAEAAAGPPPHRRAGWRAIPTSPCSEPSRRRGASPGCGWATASPPRV